MPMLLNVRPTHRQLRQFATVCVVAFPLLAWLWTRELSVTGWSAAVGGLVGLVGWLQPPLVRPLFIGLTLITFPIGLLVGELAMLLVYLLAFVPLAVVFRLLGRDALQRRDRTATGTTTRTADNSFWQPRKPVSKIASYFRQF